MVKPDNVPTTRPQADARTIEKDPSTVTDTDTSTVLDTHPSTAIDADPSPTSDPGRPRVPEARPTLSPPGVAAERTVKVLLVGDSGTGKTALWERFDKNTFTGRQQPTIAADYVTKHVTVDGRTISLELLDTAGQERYWSIITSFYRHALGIFVVYDVTREETANHVAHWVLEAKTHANQNAAVMVLGNKSDLKSFGDRNDIGVDNIRERAGLSGALEVERCYEVSAKTGEGVEKALSDMAGVLMDRQTHSLIDDIETSIEEAHHSIQLHRKQDRRTKTGCC